MTRLREHEGFTLVEVLVAMTMTMVIFVATLTLLDIFQRDTRYDTLRNETQDNARSSVDRLAREIRNVAAPSTKTAGALELAESYNVIFETIDASKTSSGANATNSMRVRYCLDDSNPENETFWRQWKRWESAEAPAVPTTTNCPDPSAAHWDGKQKLAEHVVNRIGGKNRVLFTYGPTGATLVSQIVSVEPTLYLAPAPNSRPGETQLTSTISLRNENRPPTAGFSAVETGASRVVTLNASESSDPDGLTLTYAWWDNGTKQSSTSQSWETSALVAGSKHTFKLEVTDPGGLSSTAERTVEVK
jgi:Tfp pilus assembly protein PilV